MQRLQKRNTERKPDSLVVSEAKFEDSWKYFEPPGADEEFELVETNP